MTLWIADANPDYQGPLDIDSLAREGYIGIVIKATEGATWRSSSVADRWARQARDNGMIVGAYHWLTNANVDRQLDNFLKRIEAFGWPGNMLIALDVEGSSASSPTWNSIRAWVDGWNARTGKRPFMIYTGKWWWNATGRQWDGNQLTPYLWHSQYVMQPGSKNLSMAGYGSNVYDHVPKSWWNPNYGCWPKATMLQFTSRGSAGGIVANVDLNAFNGTIGELRALAGMAPQQTQTEDDEMVLFYRLTEQTAAALGESPNAVWASNGIFRWHVPNPDEFNGIEIMGRAGAFPMFAGGEVQVCGVHIGHDVSADSRLAANTERILCSWAAGQIPYGIRFSEDDGGRQLGNPFIDLAGCLNQLMSRPVAEVTDDQIIAMATAIAEKMSTSVENVAAAGNALMAKLNAALSGVAGALSAAAGDQAARPVSLDWTAAADRIASHMEPYLQHGTE